MENISVTVAYPISVQIDVDLTQLTDDEYVEQKRNEAKDLADKAMEENFPEPLVIDSEFSGLIE